jgi:hypothetical protein
MTSISMPRLYALLVLLASLVRTTQKIHNARSGDMRHSRGRNKVTCGGVERPGPCMHPAQKAGLHACRKPRENAPEP